MPKTGVEIKFPLLLAAAVGLINCGCSSSVSPGAARPKVITGPIAGTFGGSIQTGSGVDIYLSITNGVIKGLDTDNNTNKTHRLTGTINSSGMADIVEEKTGNSWIGPISHDDDGELTGTLADNHFVKCTVEAQEIVDNGALAAYNGGLSAYMGSFNGTFQTSSGKQGSLSFNVDEGGIASEGRENVQGQVSGQLTLANGRSPRQFSGYISQSGQASFSFLDKGSEIWQELPKPKKGHSVIMMAVMGSSSTTGPQETWNGKLRPKAGNGITAALTGGSGYKVTVNLKHS